MAEIWSKKFITINNKDFSVGDIISLLCYRLDNGSEVKLNNVIIYDITENGIIVSEIEKGNEVFVGLNAIL